MNDANLGQLVREHLRIKEDVDVRRCRLERMRIAFRDLGQIEDIGRLHVHKGSQSKEGWELRRGHQSLRVEELDIETYIDCLDAWHEGRKELQRLEDQMEREGLGSYLKD